MAARAGVRFCSRSSDFVIGGIPPPTRTRTELGIGLRLTRESPLESAVDLPPPLWFGAWLRVEHWVATKAEVSYVRWADIARCLAHSCGPTAPDAAAAVAQKVRITGSVGISFSEWAPHWDFLAYTLPKAAIHELSSELDCRFYAVPLIEWSAETANAIRLDVEAEAAQSGVAGNCMPWSQCAARRWLKEQIQLGCA